MKEKNERAGCSRINLLFQILDRCPALERDEVIDAWKQESHRPHYHEKHSYMDFEERTGNTLIFRNLRISDHAYNPGTRHLSLKFCARSENLIGRRRQDGQHIGAPEQTIRINFDGRSMYPWRCVFTGEREHLYTLDDVLTYTERCYYMLELETEIVDNYINPLNMKMINLMCAEHLITCERDMYDVIKMKKHQKNGRTKNE